MPVPARLRAAAPFRRLPSLGLLLAVVAALGCGGGGSGGTDISLDTRSLTFTARYGDAAPAAKTVLATFGGDGVLVGPPAGQEMPTWLTVQQGEVSGKTVAFEIRINTTRIKPLSVVRTATLRFVTGRSDGSNLSWVDLPVSYRIDDNLVVSPTSLALAANDEAPTSRQVQVSLVSGGAAGWTAEAAPGLRLSAVSGTAGTPLEVSYDVEGQPLAAGPATASVKVSTVLDGETVTKAIPVTLDVGAHRIWAARAGVALASLPTVAALTARIPVVDNAGVTTGTWSAQSDAPWLHVDGFDGDVLAVHADPADLASGLHLAELTIASDGPRVEGPARVRIGLYVSDAAPVSGLVTAGTSERPVPDPVRPWVWVLMASDRQHVRAYNAYSGALEREVTLAHPVRRIAVSGDGRNLFGSGVTGSWWESPHDIVRVDLETGDALPSFPGDGYGVVATFRPGGHELVATENGTFYDAATGAAATAALATGGWWELTASADGRWLYGVSSYGSPPTLARARIGYWGATPALSLAQTGSVALFDQSAPRQLAVATDGSAVCFPDNRYGSTVSNGFLVYGAPAGGLIPSLGTFEGSAAETDWPRAVTIGLDGRVLAVAGTTVDCYDALLAAAPTGSHALPSTSAIPTNVAFSGDGERALVTGYADGTFASQALWVTPAH